MLEGFTLKRTSYECATIRVLLQLNSKKVLKEFKIGLDSTTKLAGQGYPVCEVDRGGSSLPSGHLHFYLAPAGTQGVQGANLTHHTRRKTGERGRETERDRQRNSERVRECESVRV